MDSHLSVSLFLLMPNVALSGAVCRIRSRVWLAAPYDEHGVSPINTYDRSVVDVRRPDLYLIVHSLLAKIEPGFPGRPLADDRRRPF